MTKSMLPSSRAQRSAAAAKLSGYQNTMSACRSNTIRMDGLSYLAHIAAANANDLGARTDLGNVFGGSFGLLDVSANDAGVGAEADQCAGLHAADGASTAGHEDDAVV